MKSPSATRILSATGFFVAGFIAHSLYLSLSKPDGDKPLSPGNALEEEIRSLTEQLAESQTENATLQSKIDEAPAFESFELEEGEGVMSTQAISFAEGRFEDMMERQVDQQLDIYAARLNLNPDQREQLKEIMLLRMRFSPDGAERLEDENGAPIITQNDIDNLAADIPSPDQLDEYDEMRAQEDEARSEMMATAQLSQIAPQLGLSETQKDQVFSIYYEQSLTMNEGFMQPEQMRASQEEADELIGEILTEEQREVFKTIRENQNAFGNFTIIAR